MGWISFWKIEQKYKNGIKSLDDDTTKVTRTVLPMFGYNSTWTKLTAFTISIQDRIYIQQNYEKRKQFTHTIINSVRIKFTIMRL